MDQLTEEQIVFIEKELNKRGLSYFTLKDELLDHICSAIENDMAEGKPFEKAYEGAISYFDEQTLQHLQRETRKAAISKRYIWRKVFRYGLGVAASLFFIVLVGHAKDRPSIHPVLINKYQLDNYLYLKQMLVYSDPASAEGIDFIVPVGTPVVATASGEVEQICTDSISKSKSILIQHTNDEYLTFYSNLSEMVVYKGQTVKKGEIIGYSGEGNASSPPHVHYQIIRNRKNINTLQFNSH